MSFFSELKRRNVVNVAVLYVVAAWLLLQVTDVLSSLLPVPDWTGALVFLLLVIAFPPVLIFSWIYELTPEGLKRETEVGAAESVTKETGRKINLAIVILLVLAIAVVLLDRLVPEELPTETAAPTDSADHPGERGAGDSPSVPARSVAVLPFVNMSADPEQEYFSDGLSEELLNVLAAVPELTVSSRTSAFSFKDKDVTIGEVARTLNVAHVLEGSVRKSGDQVRITAQLIDAGRDVHLWSDTWDRTLDDVFAIQDDIARRVVEALRPTLMNETPTVAETDSETYTLFLQARHLGHQGSREGLQTSVDLFERVLERDPTYVPALLGLATSYVNLGGSRTLPREEAYGAAQERLDKALALDPDNAKALAVTGWLAREWHGDFEASAAYYRRALALDPRDPSVLNGTAVLLMTLGRLDEALDVHEWMIGRDPVNPSTYLNTGINRFLARDRDGAKASLDQAIRLSPNAILARWWRSFMYCLDEDYERCVESGRSLSEVTGNPVFGLMMEAMAADANGRSEEAARAMAELEENHARTAGFQIGLLHAWAGRADEAVAWFRRTYEMTGASSVAFLRDDPTLDTLREDPRIEALLREAGISAEQVETIELDVPDLG